MMPLRQDRPSWTLSSTASPLQSLKDSHDATDWQLKIIADFMGSERLGFLSTVDSVVGALKPVNTMRC